MKIDAVQPGRPAELDRGLLAQFARQRVEGRLARLDAAAGQMPASHIGMPHQEDAVLPSSTAARTPSVTPREKRQ